MARTGMSSPWQSLLESTVNANVRSISRVGGGDFADSHCVTLSDQRRVFVKTHSNPPKHFFTTEATGLRWLSDTGSVSIPEVWLVSDDPPCLALEWIEEGARVTSGEEALGQQLAKLHQSPFPCFGRTDERTTGSLAVPNTPTDDWVSFYRERRLRPLMALAADRSALSSSTLSKLSTLSEQLDRFAPTPEAPSLVHGDLWAGNRIVDTDGQSWLIDPAAHGNHREFDLSMMRLFGGYGERCFAAYNETYPLDPDWVDRIPLFQLAPLIVHAIKFGGHYASATDDAVSRYVD